MTDLFVIDNSVVMSWCFKDEDNPYADAVLGRMSEATAVVPCIWPLEVVNVLMVAERRKRLGKADSKRFIALLSHLPIKVEHYKPERSMAELLSLARANDLSSYDASYLDLAMRRGAPLATLDKRLLKAAEDVNVSVL